MSALLTLTCPECGASFQRWAAWVRKARRPACSRQCNGKARGRELAAHPKHAQGAVTPEAIAKRGAKMRGANNPAWKGGVTMKRPHGSYSGVRYVRCPPDLLSMARADGYVMEHRLVMARRIGHPLLRVEVVHHKDHNPANNDPENLELWPDNRSHKLAEHGRDVSGAVCRGWPAD